MQFNAFVFGRSWNSVALAQGNDKSRPALFRTTLIEMFPDGVRLVSTDSYLLLKAWIPEIDTPDAPEPGHDELPDEVAICADVDQQVTSLMRYAQMVTKKDGADTDVAIEMRLGTMLAEQGTLAGMDQHAVTFRLDHAYDQILEAPVYDGSFPSWRPLWFSHRWTQTGLVAFGTDAFQRLGKLSALWDRASLRFELGGTLGVSKVHIIAPDVTVSGLAMPVPGAHADRSQPEEIIPVPSSVEGIDHEFGEALDDFLAEVLRTEVKNDAGDDPAVEMASRVQVLRAGNVVVAEQNPTAQIVADSLGVTLDRAGTLLTELVLCDVLAVIEGSDEDDPKYEITEDAAKILEALAVVIDDPDNPNQPDEGGDEPL